MHPAFYEGDGGGRTMAWAKIFNFDAFAWFFPLTVMLFCTAATRERG